MVEIIDLPGGDCVLYRTNRPWPVEIRLPIPDPDQPERYAPVINLSERRKRREALPEAA